MLLALVGLDEFAKDERIAKFWEESLTGGSQRRVFFATDSQDETPLTANIAQALTPSFFEPAASVLVRHSEFMSADEQRSLVNFLSGGFQGNLALDFSEIDKRSVLWKFLEKQGTAESFEPPKYSNAIQKWVSNHVQKYFKRSINSVAAQYIADAIGGDTKRINTEIKKILLYDNSIQEINIQHCSLFIKANRVVPPYELQESFGFRKLDAFLPKFRRITLETWEEAFMPIVISLRNHCMTLLHIQAMRSKKIPDNEIAARILPPRQTFFYQKNHLPEQSSRWTADALQKTILQLDEISYRKKMGFHYDLSSFELAICGLML
jgi:DNA polymerase-3 subunit delta